MAVKPIPDGFHTVTPYLLVPDGAKLIEFLKQAFAAKEIICHKTPDGRVMHAQVQIGDSMVMLAEPPPGKPASVACFYLYVPDTDALYNSAMAAGGESLMAPADQFYGDRNAGVKDAFGNQWWIATHVEDVSDEEMKRRQEKMFGQGKACG
ncbi:MAG TPA: VOC family protein [Planctomycetota bacterium]|nr:VOC family protein [Planctomycetota bacterium]